MSAAFAAAASLFLIIGLGIVFKLLTGVSDRDGILNKFGLYVGFPAIILHSLTATPLQLSAHLPLIALNVCMMTAVLLIIQGITGMLRCSVALRNSYLICCIFGNVAYLGFPFLSALYPGQESIISIHVAAYIFVVFLPGLFLLEYNNGGGWQALPRIGKNLLKNPMLLAVIAGVILSTTDIRLPQILANTVTMLAQGTPPAVLFALGMFLARRISFNRNMLHAGVITAVQLLALPLIAAALLSLTGESTASHAPVTVLCAAMPVAITPFAMADRYPMDKEIIAAAIIISTVTAFVTLPMINGL